MSEWTDEKMSYLLKHFDTPLIKFDFMVDSIAGSSVKILALYDDNVKLLPLNLEHSDMGLLQWLKQRIIPNNRAFVQSFLAKLGLNVNDTHGIIAISKGLSLNDCYWVVEEHCVGRFAQYNLYDNRFSRVLAMIAYTGYGSRQVSDFVSTPELTTNGVLAKCWRRINGKILLYKAGATGAANSGNEPYSEFYAYQVAAAMGLPVVSYNLSKWKGQLFSTCELFTSQKLAYIPTGTLVNSGGLPAVIAYYQQLGEHYYQALVDMLIFDAVICNEDRHLNNFGLLVDTQTNTVVDTAPIFDNGLSLFNYAMEADLADVTAYANTRLMANSQAFMTFAQAIITPAQKTKLRKLINFKFKKHSRYNLNKNRLHRIEQFIQIRVRDLLDL